MARLKQKVYINLPPEVVEKAREHGLNISKVSENALIDMINRIESPEKKEDLSSSVNASSKEGLIVPRPGFEPGTIEGDSPLSTPSAELKSFLDGFKDFCLVDRQLMGSTSSRYVQDVKRFLEFAKPFERRDTKVVVREFLKTVPNDGNVLRALKAYFKFIGHEEVVRGFKFPQRPQKIRYVTRKELRIFYDALRDWRERALFLFYATSGLRKMEVLSLRIEDVDFEKRMIVPRNHQGSRSKHSLLSFYNSEADNALKEYLPTRNEKSGRLFDIRHEEFCRMFREAREKTGVKISCQDLRFWFCCEMGELGVQDRYVDAFCGRVPQSVLARHYTDYSPQRLKEIYEKASFTVLHR